MKIWLLSLLPRNLTEVLPLAGPRRDNNSRNSSQAGNTNNQEAMIHYSLRAAMHLDMTNPKEEKAALNGGSDGGVGSGHLTMPSNNNHSHHLPAISNSIIPSRGSRDQDDESYLEGSYQNGGPCILYPGGDYCKPSICDPSENDFRSESLLSTSVQVCIAITLAGFGNVGAGLILDMVQHWTVFKTINELFILVPSLLGLKGNLEMTMAARLSTQANLGNMREFDTTMRMVKGNMALVQCQATVVAFLASLFALVSNAFTKGVFDIHNSLIICASSLITANVACFLLGACMVGVIILSHRYEIDPDNIATPLAASIGDVTTLALLASFAQLLQNHDPHGVFPYLSCCIIIIVMAALPLWFLYAYRNEYTASIVTTGWIPIILAMLISSMGGFILDHATNQFTRLAMFQPVVNGVGGNLVAVQASRLSTYLHKRSKLGHFPEGIECLISPYRAFIGSTINVRTARVLLMMSIPAHFLYLGVFRIIKGSEGFDMTFLFLFTYIIFAVFQVMLLLYFAHNLVMLLWRNSADPDNYSIPILTALGDFLGTAFLFMAFVILSHSGDINALST